MRISPAVEKKNAKWYAKNYYFIEDDIANVFELLDTPFLDKRLKKGMRVFDGMMGRGRHALRYAKRGCTVLGNDLNPHMVAIAKKTAKIMAVPRKNLRLMTDDVTNLKSVPSNHFDASIAMFSAIGTIPGKKNRQKAFDELARVTKPGGIVVVHGHNRWDSFFKKDFFPWVVRSYLFPDKGLETGDILSDYNGLEGMFNHFYSPREFRSSFQNAGLVVDEEAYFQYNPPRPLNGVLRKFQADGFIFVGRK